MSVTEIKNGVSQKSREIQGRFTHLEQLLHAELTPTERQNLIMALKNSNHNDGEAAERFTVSTLNASPSLKNKGVKSWKSMRK